MSKWRAPCTLAWRDIICAGISLKDAEIPKRRFQELIAVMQNRASIRKHQAAVPSFCFPDDGVSCELCTQHIRQVLPALRPASAYATKRWWYHWTGKVSIVYSHGCCNAGELQSLFEAHVGGESGKDRIPSWKYTTPLSIFKVMVFFPFLSAFNETFH